MAVPINIGAVRRDSGKSGGCVVAADVSSAVEGARPAARKERWKMSAVLKCSSPMGVRERFLRRAGRLGSTAGRMPAATEKRRDCANVNMNCYRNSATPVLLHGYGQDMALHAKWNPPNANGEAGRIARDAAQTEPRNAHQ